MRLAVSQMSALKHEGYDVGPKYHHIIIPLIGHFAAYLYSDVKDGSRDAYWEAAQASPPDMKKIEKQLADPDGLHSWALRLRLMHGGTLSSNERVEFCAHWDPEVRELALIAPADAVPATTARSGSRRKV